MTVINITDRERAKDALIVQLSAGRNALAARVDALAARVEDFEAAVMMAYGYLWCANNEPGTTNQYPPGRASYEARRNLRHLLTNEQRGQGINSVVQIVRPELKENQK